MNDLLEQQNKLQEEARKVLENLQLIELLGKFGKPNLVGSVELELMTWNDIDFEVIVEVVKKEVVAEVVSSLIKSSAHRIDFSVVDNTDSLDNSGKGPIGYYLGIKYYPSETPKEELISSNKNTWKIDIWFVREDNARTTNNLAVFKQKLTEEKRLIILDIKVQVMDNPKYKYEIFSKDIYDAVLDNNVTNMEEFEEYLKTVGKKL